MENDVQTIQTRLMQFVNHTGLAMRTFEKKTGLSCAFIRNIVHGVGSEKLRHILDVFPELDANWLITGEGQMLRQTATPTDGGATDGPVAAQNNQPRYTTYHKPENTTPKEEQPSYSTLLRIVEINQQTVAKFQNQVSELIAILKAKEMKENAG